jgi:hypothetical protein
VIKASVHVLSSITRYLWYKTAVPVFIERFLLPVFAAVLILLAFSNPMNFDWTQRITLGVALLLIAYFLAHTLHLHNTKEKELAKPITPVDSPPSAQSPAPAPDFKGTFLTRVIGRPESNSDATSIFLEVKITNLGIKSIAERYQLFVDVPGVGNVEGRRIALPNKLTLQMEDGSTEIYTDADALYIKTATPIETNDSKTGTLLFLFDGIKKTMIGRDPKMKLVFRDAAGKEYEVSDTSVLNTTTPQVFPGTTPPKRMPPKASGKKKRR